MPDSRVGRPASPDDMYSPHRILASDRLASPPGLNGLFRNTDVNNSVFDPESVLRVGGVTNTHSSYPTSLWSHDQYRTPLPRQTTQQKVEFSSEHRDSSRHDVYTRGGTRIEPFASEMPPNPRSRQCPTNPVVRSEPLRLHPQQIRQMNQRAHHSLDPIPPRRLMYTEHKPPMYWGRYSSSSASSSTSCADHESQEEATRLESRTSTGTIRDDSRITTPLNELAVSPADQDSLQPAHETVTSEYSCSVFRSVSTSTSRSTERRPLRVVNGMDAISDSDDSEDESANKTQRAQPRAPLPSHQTTIKTNEANSKRGQTSLAPTPTPKPTQHNTTTRSSTKNVEPNPINQSETWEWVDVSTDADDFERIEHDDGVDEWSYDF